MRWQRVIKASLLLENSLLWTPSSIRINRNMTGVMCVPRKNVSRRAEVWSAVKAQSWRATGLNVAVTKSPWRWAHQTPHTLWLKKWSCYSLTAIFPNVKLWNWQYSFRFQNLMAFVQKIKHLQKLNTCIHSLFIKPVLTSYL